MQAHQRQQSRTTPTRQDRARVVRDAVIEWLGLHGRVESTNQMRIATGHLGRWSFSLRTPFSGKLPSRQSRSYAEAALAQRAASLNLPYGLDIWASDGGKVFNIEWTHNDAIDLVSFRAGDWDTDLLSDLAAGT